MKADETDDGGATGDADEPYVQVFQGLGINQRYFEKIELGSIDPQQTIHFNKTVYEGPRIQARTSPTLPSTSWTGTTSQATITSEAHCTSTIKTTRIMFGPGTARSCSDETAATVTCKYEIDGDSDKYEMSFSATLH